MVRSCDRKGEFCVRDQRGTPKTPSSGTSSKSTKGGGMLEKVSILQLPDEGSMCVSHTFSTLLLICDGEIQLIYVEWYWVFVATDSYQHSKEVFSFSSL